MRDREMSADQGKERIGKRKVKTKRRTLVVEIIWRSGGVTES